MHGDAAHEKQQIIWYEVSWEQVLPSNGQEWLKQACRRDIMMRRVNGHVYLDKHFVPSWQYTWLPLLSSKEATHSQDASYWHLTQENDKLCVMNLYIVCELRTLCQVAPSREHNWCRQYWGGVSWEPAEKMPDSSHSDVAHKQDRSMNITQCLQEITHTSRSWVMHLIVIAVLVSGHQFPRCFVWDLDTRV